MGVMLVGGDCVLRSLSSCSMAGRLCIAGPMLTRRNSKFRGLLGRAGTERRVRRT